MGDGGGGGNGLREIRYQCGEVSESTDRWSGEEEEDNWEGEGEEASRTHPNDTSETSGLGGTAERLSVGVGGCYR